MSEHIWKTSFTPQTFKETEKIQGEVFSKLQYFVKTSNMPHLMFSGPKGSGKSTMAKLFARNMVSHPQNIFFVNAKDSITKKERDDAKKLSRVSSNSVSSSAGTYKTVRPFIQVRILPYATSKPFGGDNFNILIVNDFDELGIEQEAFRRIIERYSKTCRMILLTSRLSKIIDPIVSRVRIMTFSRVSPDVFRDIIEDILEPFDIECSVSDIEKVYELVNGNVTKGIDLCQYTYEIFGDIDEKNIQNAFDSLFGMFRTKIIGIFHSITMRATLIAIQGIEDLLKMEYFEWHEFIGEFTTIVWTYSDVMYRNVVIKKLAEIDAKNKDHMDIRPNLYDLVYELIEVYEKLLEI